MERIKRLIRPLQCGLILSTVSLLSSPASAGPVSFLSYTGTLDTPQSVLEATFTLTDSDTVTFQTWGFGGGGNAAGAVIPAGGFDPLIALFSGSGPTATIVTDGSGDVLADADNLNNPPFSPVGNCPPAGTVTIGTGIGSALCGDDYLQAVDLAAGIYTLTLSTADYIPNSVDPGAPTYSTIGDGFTDISGPATGFGSGSAPYQTCNFTSDQPDGVCIDPNGKYAVDIVSTEADLTTASPEPGALSLLGAGLAGLATLKRFKNRRMSPHSHGAKQ